MIKRNFRNPGISTWAMVGLSATLFAFLCIEAHHLGKSAVVHAQSGCAASSFSGAYGYSLSGFDYDLNGNFLVFAAAGRMISDGTGNITSGADTGSDDGVIIRRKYTGTYTVNQDCTGSIVMQFPAGTAQGDIVLVNNGREINFIQTNTDVIVTGVLKPQSVSP